MRSTLLSLTFVAMALVANGCILFEDPSEVEGTDVITTDQVIDADFGDIPEDLEDCSDNNPLSCGSSCTNCTTLQAVVDVACVSGVCRIDSCQEGFANCDGQPANGCEQAETNRACGAMCDDCLDRPQSLGGTCEMGACVLDCEPGFYNCDGNLQNGCERMESETSCGESCLDCSALDNVDRATCTAGTCLISECSWGWLDCNGDPADGCEQPASDSTCGPGCNLDCASLAGVDTARCAGSTCAIATCAPNRLDANGDWTDGCEKTCELGECWQIAPRAFQSVAFLGSDGVGLAGATDGLIYYTEDDGVTWSELDTPLDNNVRAVAYNGINVAVAVGNNGTVIRSIDRGLTWQQVPLPAGSGTPLEVAADGERFVLVGTGTLLTSEDRGRTWTDISDKIDGADLRSAYVSGDLILVGGATGSLLRSEDGGETVTVVPEPTMATIRFIESAGGSIIAGGNAFLIQSQDGGLNWTDVPGTPDPQLNWRGFASDGSISLLVAGSQIAYRGAAADPFTVVDVTEGDTLIGAHIVGGTVRFFGNNNGFGHTFAVTTDEEVSYRRLDLTHADNAFEFVYDQGTLMLTGGSTGGLLLRSGDDGATWNQVADGLIDQGLRYPSLPAGTAGILAADSVNVLRTTDAGENWELSLAGATDYEFFDAAWAMGDEYALVVGRRAGLSAVFVGAENAQQDFEWQVRDCSAGGACQTANPTSPIRAVAIASGTNAVIGDGQGQILQTTDSGANFVSVLGPLGSATLDLFYEGSEIRVLTSTTIWRSTDDGMTWPDATMMGNAPVYDGAAEMIPVTLSAWDFDGMNGIAAANTGRVVITNDGGGTWTMVETGETANFTHAVAMGSSLVAISSNGVVAWSNNAGMDFQIANIDTRGQAITDVVVDGNRIGVVAGNGQVIYSYGP